MESLTSGHAESAAPSPAPHRSTTLTQWGLAVCMVLVAVVGFYAYSTRRALDERIAGLEQQTADRLADEMRGLRKDTASLASDVAAVTKRVGATAEELDTTRELAATLKRAHEETAAAVAANSAGVTAVRESATSQVAGVDRKVGQVSTEVKEVSARLDTTRDDLVETRNETTKTTTAIRQQVAQNASELAELRRKGERAFYEFDITKDRGRSRVGDIQIQLTKADVRRSKYDVVLLVDDSRLEKKDRTTNEPVAFLVGREKLRYELVVNTVAKDRISGYVSVPKDRALGAERPGDD